VPYSSPTPLSPRRPGASALEQSGQAVDTVDGRVRLGVGAPAGGGPPLPLRTSTVAAPTARPPPMSAARSSPTTTAVPGPRPSAFEGAQEGSSLMKAMMLLALALSPVAAAQQAELGGKVRSGRQLTIPAGERVQGDLIATAGTVRIDGRIDGDLVASGGQVTVAGTVTGDLVAAAATTTLSGEVEGDARVAAGQARVQGRGRVGEDLLVAAGQATVAPGGQGRRRPGLRCRPDAAGRGRSPAVSSAPATTPAAARSAAASGSTSASPGRRGRPRWPTGPWISCAAM
jgi:cytoskeletal protein CcmA (bactofilin family)